MNPTFEEKKYLKSLIKKYGELKLDRTIRDISKQIFQEEAPLREEKYRKNKERYKKTKERQYLKGQEFKKQVENGDIVQMRGTNDKGYRLVLDTNEYELHLQQLNFNWRTKEFTKGNYLTQQSWDKVVKIVEKQGKNSLK